MYLVWRYCVSQLWLGDYKNHLLCHGWIMPHQEGQLFLIDSTYSLVHNVITSFLLLDYCIAYHPNKVRQALGNDIPTDYPLLVEAFNQIVCGTFCASSPRNPWPGTVEHSAVQITSNYITIIDLGLIPMNKNTALSYLRTRPGIPGLYQYAM